MTTTVLNCGIEVIVEGHVLVHLDATREAVGWALRPGEDTMDVSVDQLANELVLTFPERVIHVEQRTTRDG